MFLRSLLLMFMWGLCFLKDAKAIEFTAALNSGSPHFNSQPYQLCPFTVASNGTTIGVNLLSNNTGAKPWYMIFNPWVGTILTNAIFDSSTNSYPDNFSLSLDAGSNYALWVSTWSSAATGVLTLSLTGVSNNLNVPSGSQTFVGSRSDVRKQGAGLAIIEGSLSGTTTIEAGSLQIGDGSYVGGATGTFFNG